MAGFYMIGTAAMKELKSNVTFLIRNLKGSSIISDQVLQFRQHFFIKQL